jgi:hypothetical protein
MGLFTNPWVLLGILVMAVGLFLWGLRLGQAQLREFEAQVEAVGKIQAAWSKQRAKIQTQITKAKDDEHERRTKELSGAYMHLAEQLRNFSPGSRSLPPVPGDPKGGPGVRTPVEDGSATVCFNREKLRRGMDAAFQRFGAGAGESILRGARTVDLAQTCSSWALEQWTAAQEDKQPATK